jgi:plastocyanin
MRLPSKNSLFAAYPVLIGLSLSFQFTAHAQPAPGDESGEIHGRITGLRGPVPHVVHLGVSLLSHYAAPTTSEAAMLVSPRQVQTPALSENTVVYLQSDELSRDKYQLPVKPAVLDQKRLEFHPQVLPVMVGTTVEFPNRDPLYHNVFSYSATKEFDLGRYPMNDSRSVTFNKTGVVRVYCDIHSEMNAIILVLPHPFFTVPQNDGTFVLSDVPPGKYVLVVWHGREEAGRRTVVVRAGENTEIDLAF